MVLATPARFDTLLRAYGLLENLHAEIAAIQGGLWLPDGNVVSVRDAVCCPGVPQVMVIEAKYALTKLAAVDAQDIITRSLGWLAHPHQGLKMWEGVQGRGYRTDEQEILADDQAVLQATPCPFLRNGTCILGSARPLLCRVAGLEVSAHTAQGKRLVKAKARLTNWLRWTDRRLLLTSWLPTLLAREVARDAIVALRQEGKTADIKLALSSEPVTLFQSEDIL